MVRSRQCVLLTLSMESYLLYCGQRVRMSEHDPVFIPLLQLTLKRKKIHPQSGHKEQTQLHVLSFTTHCVVFPSSFWSSLATPCLLFMFVYSSFFLMYLAVGAVDESSFRQQVTEEAWQVSQFGNVQDLSHPTCHIHHGLMREAHVQSPVASF